jgi:sensor histidine kinase YesM
MYREIAFVFSKKYRVLRHIVFWIAAAIVFTIIFRTNLLGIGDQVLVSLIWTPLQMAFAYPIMYVFIPRLLLKGNYGLFIVVMLLWAIVGWFWNYACRTLVFYTLVENVLGLRLENKNPWAAASYLAIVVVAGLGSSIILFKYWIKKHQDFLNAEKEKMSAELQLLKAQIHPHFLFNTLNNIYSFSMKGSEKTTPMIAKLSSLLSYMLYECKSNEVLLEKELEVMKNYIDLEKERYGNKLEVSLNIEGTIQGNYIAPLLLLPFIENAFKHGTSEQLEKPWLSIDISVKQNALRAKILNSKNEHLIETKKGIGIENVKKRLSYLYPGQHSLDLSDEGNFFVVSIMLDLNADLASQYKRGSKTRKREENLSV